MTTQTWLLCVQLFIMILAIGALDVIQGTEEDTRVSKLDGEVIGMILVKIELIKHIFDLMPSDWMLD